MAFPSTKTHHFLISNFGLDKCMRGGVKILSLQKTLSGNV
jgi:hypothetical protein